MTYVRPDRGTIASSGFRARRKAFRVARASRAIHQEAFSGFDACFLRGLRKVRNGCRCGLPGGVCGRETRDPEGCENSRLREWDVIEDLVRRSFARVVLFKPIVQTWQVREMMGHFDDPRAVFTVRAWPDAVNSIARFFDEGVRRAVSGWVTTDFEKVSAWGVSPSIQATAKRNWP